MTIKIGIAGTHSTGKSTFVEILRQDFQNAGYQVRSVNDLASEAQRSGFPILREHTFNSTLWIMSRGIMLELEASLRADIVLVDRPVPDALGYLLAALKTRSEQLQDWEQDYLFDLTRHHTQTYTLFFKTVIDSNLPIGTNKPRDHDPEFRILAAKEIDTVFRELAIPFEALDTSNIQQAKKQANVVVLKALNIH